jgi:hypothetical protein
VTQQALVLFTSKLTSTPNNHTNIKHTMNPKRFSDMSFLSKDGYSTENHAASPLWVVSQLSTAPERPVLSRDGGSPTISAVSPTPAHKPSHLRLPSYSGREYGTLLAVEHKRCACDGARCTRALGALSLCVQAAARRRANVDGEVPEARDASQGHGSASARSTNPNAQSVENDAKHASNIYGAGSLQKENCNDDPYQYVIGSSSTLRPDTRRHGVYYPPSSEVSRPTLLDVQPTIRSYGPLNESFTLDDLQALASTPCFTPQGEVATDVQNKDLHRAETLRALTHIDSRAAVLSLQKSLPQRRGPALKRPSRPHTDPRAAVDRSLKSGPRPQRRRQVNNTTPPPMLIRRKPVGSASTSSSMSSTEPEMEATDPRQLPKRKDGLEHPGYTLSRNICDALCGHKNKSASLSDHSC